ncbi:MAG: hypothetical protein ACMUHM_05620 [Thermoplasmatota archaeon]
MIRYLIVLYLGLVSIVLIDPNPLWAAPLLIILAGLLWEKKWLSLIGVLAFSIVSLGHIDTATFSDLPRMLLLAVSLVLPVLVLIELSLSERPYRLQRISLLPVLVSTGMLLGFFLALFLLVRVQRIGIYLSSDGLLQVFILMALSIFLTAPVLLGSRPSDAENSSSSSDSQPSTIKTNK